MKHIVKRLFWHCAALAAVAVLGFYYGHYSRSYSDGDAKLIPLRENSSKYKFISPLLASGDLEISKSFKDLRARLSDKIEEDVKNGSVGSASVYFRDLNSGAWTGVNENEQYAPASMYKVVLMIALLKEAYENDSGLLNRKMTIKNKSTKMEEIFTVGQIIRIMITQSDNNAKDVLESIIKPLLEQKVFSDFGLLPPDFNNDGDSLSPKEYSIFFRALYNSSYLGPELSEAALAILAETEFGGGLVAGVASSSPIAHKFGYRVFSDGVKFDQELHDCGIIYYPKHPYFICAMTRGSDIEDLKAVIKGLSEIAYKYVDKKIKDN